MKNSWLKKLVLFSACLSFVGWVSHAEARRAAVELDEAEVLLEENTTDGDVGFHLFADGEGWRRLILFSPRYRLMADITVRGRLRDVGLTEVFSESAEPGYEDEEERAEFIAQFPEGTYRYFGILSEGGWLYGEAELTHDIPAGPEITAPLEDAEIDPEEDLVVSWNTVADPDAPDSMIVSYEVVVEKDEDEERLRIFRVDALATDTSVVVPSSFFEVGKAYKVEVLAQETSGNRAASEVEFETEGEEE